MTKNKIRYLDGYHEGIRYAEYMRENSLATGGYEIDSREEARTAVDIAHTDEGRAYAAWCLGFVRGFREVVR